MLHHLRKARQEAGLNQRQLGAIIGKNQSHFAKIERGEIDLSARDAITLASYLQTTVESLLKVSD